MPTFLLDNSHIGNTLALALGASALDESEGVDTWPRSFWDDQACLVVHVNLLPRRSQRRGLELVERLRWEWGMTAPVLFVSFEAEETLRGTQHGTVLAEPGHSFLRLPTTVAEIREALEGVPPVVDPERYRRSAVAAAVGRLLDGPLSDWKTVLADSKRALDWWRNGIHDRDTVRERLADAWWREWQTGIAACRDQLAHWPEVAPEALTCLGKANDLLNDVGQFGERVLDVHSPGPPAAEVAETIKRLGALGETVDALQLMRREVGGHETHGSHSHHQKR